MAPTACPRNLYQRRKRRPPGVLRQLRAATGAPPCRYARVPHDTSLDEQLSSMAGTDTSASYGSSSGMPNGLSSSAERPATALAPRKQRGSAGDKRRVLARLQRAHPSSTLFGAGAATWPSLSAAAAVASGGARPEWNRVECMSEVHDLHAAGEHLGRHLASHAPLAASLSLATSDGDAHKAFRWVEEGMVRGGGVHSPAAHGPCGWQ